MSRGYSPLGKTILGTGRCLDPGKNLKLMELAIPDSDRARHMFIFGTTGVGKTRLAENIIEQDIRAGRSVVFLDPKNDQEIASKIVQIATACNRQDDLMFINTAYPEYSALIDPLSHYFIQEELVGHCIAGIKEGKEPYFRNVGKEITTAIVSALNCIAKASGQPRAQFNLNQIKKRMSRSELEILKEQLSGISTPEAADIEDDLLKIIDTGPEYYNKVASSLRVALGELTTGNIGKIIGKADENRFISRLEEGRTVILVCQLGSLIVNEAAFTLGKVILSMIQSFIGRVYASNRKKIDPPLCVHIDEAQSVVYRNIEDSFAKGGSAQCWFTAYAQGLDQLYAVMGEDFAKSILLNCNTRLFMKCPDAETAEYAVKHFGTNKVLSPVISQDSITSREVEEDVIKPYDVISLKPREFYMMTYASKEMSGRFKGRTHDSSERWLDIEYPDAPASVS